MNSGGTPPGYNPPPGYGTPPPGYGTPPPGYGAQPPGFGGQQPGFGSPQLASWGERVVSFLVDWVIGIVMIIPLFIIAIILGAISSALGTLAFVVGIAAVFFLTFFFRYKEGETGQSPGKAVTGLRVVGAQTGQPIGDGNGIIRMFAHIVDVPCYIGFLFPLFDSKRQTFADKIMTSVVLNNQSKEPFMKAITNRLPNAVKGILPK